MSTLEQILAVKQEELVESKRMRPIAVIAKDAQTAPKVRPFRAALERMDGIGLIAEVKKASPSKGLLRQHFDPVSIARSYEEAGAHALSVVTDAPFFQGSLQNLTRIRSRTDLPILRKDFIVDPYQVYESRANGADAILLIVAALDKDKLKELSGLAKELGMEVLAEVHSKAELKLALDLKFQMIGVNNRNLATLKTSLQTSDRLLPEIKRKSFAISESAITKKADVLRVKKAGAKAVLIGTVFCEAPNIVPKVREVMGW